MPPDTPTDMPTETQTAAPVKVPPLLKDIKFLYGIDHEIGKVVTKQKVAKKIELYITRFFIFKVNNASQPFAN